MSVNLEESGSEPEKEEVDPNRSGCRKTPSPELPGKQSKNKLASPGKLAMQGKSTSEGSVPEEQKASRGKSLAEPRVASRTEGKTG